MKKCPKCKTGLSDEATRCAVCGYEFPRPPKPTPEPVQKPMQEPVSKLPPEPVPNKIHPVLIVTLAVFAAAFLIEIAVYINI